MWIEWLIKIVSVDTHWDVFSWDFIENNLNINWKCTVPSAVRTILFAFAIQISTSELMYVNREMVWGLARTTMRNVCTACSIIEIRCDKIGFHCMRACVHTFLQMIHMCPYYVWKPQTKEYSNFVYVSLAIERTEQCKIKTNSVCDVTHKTLHLNEFDKFTITLDARWCEVRNCASYEQ